MKIYVGNLSYATTEEEIRKEFEAHGQVESATLITDRHSGQSKGFAFVEMPDEAQAKAAMSALNGKDIRGRALNINEARPREDTRGPRTGGYGTRPAGGGGRGRGRF